MNIEIANRLVQLRKSNNLSQEALAEKLGISRQAVSKWERAEASPDTDNLILLARLYQVSLDELLQTEDEIPTSGGMPSVETEVWGDDTDWDAGSAQGGGNQSDSDNEEYVHVGFKGIHVKDKDSEVHVGWDGIHVDDRKSDSVHIDKNGVYVNGERYDKVWISNHNHFPVALIIIIAYLVIGCMWNAWHPGWLLFLLIPIWHSLIEAIYKKDPRRFAYPVLVALIFLCLGIFAFMWHPGWVVFVTIPLYYSLAEYFMAKSTDWRYRKQARTENAEEQMKAGDQDEW